MLKPVGSADSNRTASINCAAAGPSRAGLSRMRRAPDDQGSFPTQDTTLVKALACERPTDHGRPLSRLSVFDVCQEAWRQGCTMSYSTVWRRLDEDALRPWFHRPWLFPRHPDLLAKATPVLELYQRRWHGSPGYGTWPGGSPDSGSSISTNCAMTWASASPRRSCRASARSWGSRGALLHGAAAASTGTGRHCIRGPL